MPERPEPSYVGDQPFFFVSYGHADSDLVYPEMRWLQEAGFNLWHDDGIHVGSVWRKAIADALTGAAGMLFVATKSSVESDHCLKELSFVLDEGKPVFVVQLDDTKLPGLLRLSLADRQMLNRAEFDEKTYRGKLIQALSTVAQPVERASARAPATAPPTAPAAETPLPLPSKPSIAVLPFADMTGSGGQDYFVDGMVDEITAALSRVRSIFVIASSSALTFKGKGVGAQEAARQLGVRYVLEGSVRKAANRVRIAVQLIDASDGVQIWTQRFEDTLEDVFALQDKVALAVAGQIEPTVQAAEIRRATARPTENMSSYDLYLRALPPWRTNSRAGYFEARELANRAIALDPTYGSALALSASCQWLIVTFGWSDDPEGDTRLGNELAQRALSAASDDAFVVSVAALVAFYLERDINTAISLSDRAIALNPGSALVWVASSALRLLNGELDLASEQIETSLRLDPTGPDRAAQMLNLGNARFFQHRFSEAASHFRELVQRAPDNPAGYTSLASAYGHLGQLSEGRATLARFRTLSALAPADFVRLWAPFLPAEQIQLFSDGLTLVEASDQTDKPAGD